MKNYSIYDEALSCGCIDYHMADCPLVTGNASDYDAPEPVEYSNLEYLECAHNGEPFDGDIVTDSDGSEWIECPFCDEMRRA